MGLLALGADGGPDPDSEHGVSVSLAGEECGGFVEDLVPERFCGDGASLDRGGSVALAEQVVRQLGLGEWYAGVVFGIADVAEASGQRGGGVEVGVAGRWGIPGQVGQLVNVAWPESWPWKKSL